MSARMAVTRFSATTASSCVDGITLPRLWQETGTVPWGASGGPGLAGG
jgi:hypothetical protein